MSKRDLDLLINKATGINWEIFLDLQNFLIEGLTIVKGHISLYHLIVCRYRLKNESETIKLVVKFYSPKLVSFQYVKKNIFT